MLTNNEVLEILQLHILQFAKNKYVVPDVPTTESAVFMFIDNVTILQFVGQHRMEFLLYQNNSDLPNFKEIS